jgi:translation initiation factor IF-1
MPGESAFSVEGVVTEVLSDRTCRVRLANGHVVFGFVTGRRKKPVKLVGGQQLWVKLSPYDLSKGRVLTEQVEI